LELLRLERATGALRYTRDVELPAKFGDGRLVDESFVKVDPLMKVL
jgi:hypothetical protein